MLRRSNVGSATARKSRNKVSAPSVANRLARAVAVERLEERWVLASITANNVAELISAINTANANNESDTIVLSKQTYTLTAQDNFWYGPNGLPAITSDITIDGNGATIERSSAANTPKFRLFYVAGDATVSPTLSPGTLTLKNLTLQGGLAKGGDGREGGGGGLGAGGAVYNQGTVTLNGVLATGNTAQGGAGLVTTSTGGGGGGGGMGGDGGTGDGGGGGGMGGNGGSSIHSNVGTGAGGGGFAGNGGNGAFVGFNDSTGGGGGGGQTLAGGNATKLSGGAGGDATGGAGGTASAPAVSGGIGGGGGGGGIANSTWDGAAGGLFGGGGGAGSVDPNDGGKGGTGGFGGGGGGKSAGLSTASGGTGGVGGGGGGTAYGSGGNGGFGGGGGSTGSDVTGASGGNGGFGGGGAMGGRETADGTPGIGGFAAGAGTKVTGTGTDRGGGGGAGLGGVIFNDGGTATVVNSTLTANTAMGGTGGNNGRGLGGAIFARNGTTTVQCSTLTLNVADAGRQAYGLADGFQVTYTILSSILAQSDTAVSDLFIEGRMGLTADFESIVRNHNTGMSFTTSDPLLTALADNGGYTRTIRPSAASPAIDRSFNSLPSLTTDQRGPGYARVSGIRADIGAFELDTVAPTVTINQGLHQDDPATAGPIHFDVTFSEPVTGFDASDVDLSASTAGGPLAVTINGSGSLYFIKVTGMTSAGTVVASIMANSVTDAGGNSNNPSTSTDNTVSYEPNSAPTTTGIVDKTVLEDSGTTIINLRDFFADNEDGAAGLTYTIVGNTNTALLASVGVDDPTDQLSLTPAADANGGTDITIRATDAGGKWVEDTFTFNVTPVSDISIGDVSLAEGSDGALTEFLFPVTRDESTGTATVDFATANGTAGTSGDYLAATGSVDFADGETSKFVKVSVKADINIEADQDFFVNLTNPSAGSSITRASGRGLIINDDSGTPGIAVSDVSVNEGNSGTKVMTFTVTLSRPTDQLVTVKYATVNGTATSGTDYVAANGTLKFIPRQLSNTVTVTIKSDTIIEPDETFKLNLSSPTNAVISDGSAVGIILNDDHKPVMTVADVSVTEGTGSGTVAMTFTIKLDKAASGTVTVHYATANDTATGNDYTAKSGTLTLAAGELTKTVTILVNKDSLKEKDETLFLNLSALTGPATLGRAQAKGTIRNDD